eukprot:349681-Chlamydomonas_euryale.AAC.3
MGAGPSVGVVGGESAGSSVDPGSVGTHMCGASHTGSRLHSEPYVPDVAEPLQAGVWGGSRSA